MDPAVSIIALGIRILITIYVANKASSLNRSGVGWGFFAFFLPLIAAIAIQFMKPIMKWDEGGAPIDQNR